MFNTIDYYYCVFRFICLERCDCFRFPSPVPSQYIHVQTKNCSLYIQWKMLSLNYISFGRSECSRVPNDDMDKKLVYILFIVLCDGYADELSCGLNQELKCVNECPPEKTCKTRNREYDCLPSGRPCKTRCACKDDFVRNAIGECILATDCDKCIRDHEFYSPCGGACDNKCSSLDTQSRANCNIPTLECVQSCYCEDGYARDEDKNCIPIWKCNHRCTGPHEYYVKNKKTCPPDECSSLLSISDCSKLKPSPPGCICQDTFLRPEKGAPCISQRECPGWSVIY